jgi:hypothetical protein
VIIVLDYASVDGNAPPDFAKVKAAGASAVIFRGAYGYAGSAHLDPTIHRDSAAARAAGLRVGAYLFLSYDASPVFQAAALDAVYGRQAGDLPVALDLEMDHPPPGTDAMRRLQIAEQAIAALRSLYGQRSVMVYTSLQQWLDHFGDLDSAALGSAPLWLKTPYAWNLRNPPKLDSAGPLGQLPRPWRRPGSPGAWLQQFQGDALGWDGFSSTVDLSQFLTWRDSAVDSRSTWVKNLAPNVATWQALHGLDADGIIGPATFSALCA